MHADVPEARVLSELLLVPGDHLVDGIGDQLVVEPPPRHGALGVEVELGRGGDVVALPRVWMERIDLPLRVVSIDGIVEVADAWIELPMRQHSRGASDLVDEVPDAGRHMPGEVLGAERLRDVPRRSVMLYNRHGNAVEDGGD